MLKTTMRCDFCNKDCTGGKLYQYDVEPFLEREIKLGPMTIVVLDDNAWVACEECSERIEMLDKEGLWENTIRLYKKDFPNHPDEMAREAVIESHTQFWGHLRGTNRKEVIDG